MEEYKFYGISGKVNLFAFPHCETDRFWRKSLGLTPERYLKTDDYQFDECNNAFVKLKQPVSLDLLQHLHKYADYQ
jgi:hypothetical protein